MTDLLQQRYYEDGKKHNDIRNAYARDKGRIIHSAGFRRLQSKTQIMPIGESDYHRTRLTHSLEVAQIGEGILLQLRHRFGDDCDIMDILPEESLLVSACYAHDLGHPPFGHAGENALFRILKQYNSILTFEGNGQSLRNLTKLENYHPNGGINPSRRLLLAILKYPAPFGAFDISDKAQIHPPKCFYDSEKHIVDWAMDIFLPSDKERFCQIKQHDYHKESLLTNHFSGKTIYKTLDCSMMEIADDIAYSIHDVEDMIARRLINESAFQASLQDFIKQHDKHVGHIELNLLTKALYGDERTRKQMIARLVHEMISSVDIHCDHDFQHALLRYQAKLPPLHGYFIDFMKIVTMNEVINHPMHQQLDRKYERIITGLFTELRHDVKRFIPTSFIMPYHDSDDEIVRDYIAQMTSPQAERAYHRFFTPQTMPTNVNYIDVG